MKNTPTAFISYSWDDDDHKKWVKAIAIKLRDDGVDVKLDQWELIPGDQLPSFMEKSIRDVDFVLIICTPNYKRKSDKRKGGVGYEGDIITAELFQNQNHRKFIPLLRKSEWIESAPSWISGKYYIDLRDAVKFHSNYEDLITTILNIREAAPPIGQYHHKTTDTSIPNKEEITENDEILIKGILVDEVGEPLKNGTPGSALYKIPFELNRRPDYVWRELFRQTWDRPPQWTGMHRPGIGYVIGNKIILDGTTIEEVKKYHKDTLKLVVESVNKRYKEIILQEKLKKEREEKERINHRNNIKNIADDIEF
ncbi:MAG: toll/interleukin-1 receptor domain-containing protein [Bacteroidales bacterium]